MHGFAKIANAPESHFLKNNREDPSEHASGSEQEAFARGRKDDKLQVSERTETGEARFASNKE